MDKVGFIPEVEHLENPESEKKKTYDKEIKREREGGVREEGKNI